MIDELHWANPHTKNRERLSNTRDDLRKPTKDKLVRKHLSHCFFTRKDYGAKLGEVKSNYFESHDIVTEATLTDTRLAVIDEVLEMLPTTEPRLVNRDASKKSQKQALERGARLGGSVLYGERALKEEWKLIVDAALALRERTDK